MHRKSLLIALCGAALAATAPMALHALGQPDHPAMQRFGQAATFTPVMSMDEAGVRPLDALPAPSALLPRHADSTETASVPTIYGSLIVSKTGADGSAANAKGMWTFNATGPIKRLTTNTNAQYGGAPMDNGYYYAIMRSGANYYWDRFAISTWTRSNHTKLTNNRLAASDVAYDPTTDFVYGCFYNDTGDGYVFGRADYATRTREVIKPLSIAYNAVMADADGQVYAIDMTGLLLKVDKATGNTTEVGHTGITPAYASSGTIDLNTGRCFWTVNPINGKGYLYEVNLTTGRATLLHEFAHSDEFTGIYVPEAAPAASAPAAASSLKANFSEGSLTGTVSFTLPAKATDGTDLTGSVDYTLWVDGVSHTVANGAPGTEVSVPVTLAASGKHSAVVRCCNDAGASRRTKAKFFAGNDTPKAPAPVLSRTGDAFTVSWNRVTASVNGGYINPDSLTYKVTRLPDNVVVAEATSDTVFVDPVAATPGRVIAYRYTVAATFAGNRGAPGTTGAYPLGVITAPWSEGFDNAAAMDNFLILDGNADNVKWQYSGGMSSAYITTAKVKHDDWLITAAIHMEKGVKYKLAFEAMASFEPERIEVRMGTSADPAAMTTQLVAPTDLEPDFSLKPSVPEFTVPETGLYYIGWHAISDANAFYLYVDNITLTDDANHEGNAVTPPYLQTFSESAALKDFTIVDANKDGYMWNIDQGEARVNGSDNIDDWLISPPMKMTAGNRYEVSVQARAYYADATPSYLEMRVGNAAVVDSMQTVLIPVAALTDPNAPVKLARYFAPTADGTYYFAMHAAGEGMGVYADNFRVAAPVTAQSPAAPTDCKVTPAQYGELRATVSFKAPALTVGGETLASMDKVEVAMGDSVVQTFAAPQPGMPLECDVTVPAFGTYDFVVTAYNAAGAGIPAEFSGYIGVGVPSTPTDVVLSEEGNTGKILLTWHAPRTDVNGNLIRPEGIKYIVADVINGQSVLLARDIADTTFSIQAVASDGAQQFKTYAVFATNAAGTSQGLTSNSAPVGKPYPIPYYESFPQGANSTLIVTQVLQPEGQWNTYNDGTIDVSSHDGDNGFCGFLGKNAGSAGAFFTGKITLEDDDKVELVFYTYNPYSDNTNEVVVQLLDAQGTAHTLLQKPMSEIGTNGWNRVALPLTPYRGQTVRLAFATYLKRYTMSLFDHIRIDKTLGVDGTLVPEVSVMGGQGRIDILGADNRQVTVTDLQGRVRYSARVADTSTVAAEPGVYIVRCGSLTFKVMVK